MIQLCSDVYFSSGEATGEGPRRTAFQKALEATVDVKGCWKEMGDTIVPDTSPVTDNKYWRVTGALLALALLAGENLHPISPAIVYALLSNVHPRSDVVAPMDMSLSLIQQLQISKADALLPWMIIPPGQDWKNLPDGHRGILRQVITNLDLNVSTIISLFSLEMRVKAIFYSAINGINPVHRRTHPMDTCYHHCCNVWKPPLFFNSTIPGNGTEF